MLDFLSFGIPHYVLPRYYKKEDALNLVDLSPVKL